MKRIDDIDGSLFRRGIARFEFEDGTRIDLFAHDVKRYGLNRLVEMMGYGDKISHRRIPVMQHGRQIGTLPASFDPMSTQTTSWLYQIRSDDFKRVGDEWIAMNNLGPGDFEAIPQFIWSRNESTSEPKS